MRQSGLGSPFRFDGAIDEPSVWARALSAAEIGEIENRSSLGKCDFIPVEQAKLTSASTLANDKFGSSVAVSGTTAAIGAPLSSRFAPFDGSVYVYTGSGPTWTEQARLSPTDPDEQHVHRLLGRRRRRHGDRRIGRHRTPRQPTAARPTCSPVRAPSWAQQAKLVASDGAANDRLGYAVAIDGDTAVATAFGDDDAGSDSGAAYVFTRSGATWTEQAKLVAVRRRSVRQLSALLSPSTVTRSSLEPPATTTLRCSTPALRTCSPARERRGPSRPS